MSRAGRDNRGADDRASSVGCRSGQRAGDDAGGIDRGSSACNAAGGIGSGRGGVQGRCYGCVCLMSAIVAVVVDLLSHAIEEFVETTFVGFIEEGPE